MDVTRTQAIKNFLLANTVSDLAELYNYNMEVQVNVSKGNGERVVGEYKGRDLLMWTDGIQTWKPLRIPYNADSNPEYTDKKMTYDLDAHAEGIGMTGWDWVNKLSRWVAFDFDAITGHKDTHTKKLTDEELRAVREAVETVPWVTVRRSSGGRGLHLYVFLDPVSTATHTEHAAVARAVLGKLSAVTGFDFRSKVDTCGGNMWVWNRKMVGTQGFQLLKSSVPLEDVPSNWRDHTPVIRGTRQRTKLDFVDDESNFSDLIGQRPKIDLSDEHRKLLEYLTEANRTWWWDQDHGLLVTHTYSLKLAHEALQLRGVFETNATGKEQQDYNCFCFPLRGGAWAIRRFSQGAQEHVSWDQDKNGWTRCYFNREADMATAAKFCGGTENAKGAFIFREAELAVKAANLLGANINLDAGLLARSATIKRMKDSRLVVEVKQENTDSTDRMQGWLPEKGYWQKIFKPKTKPVSETETGNYEDIVRHLVSENGQDFGWVVKSSDQWRDEPITHIRLALTSMGVGSNELSVVMGTSIMKAWTIVNMPFQPEYPGDRKWNRHAAQFRFPPSTDKDNLHFPTWSKIMNHVGKSLDEAVGKHPWCIANGIKRGSEWLKCWLASLFQSPYGSLPYLFLYGPQASGKSIFHESLDLLVTKGYQKVESALTSKSNFNGEMLSALICVVEEIDLQRNKDAYNKLKDWVTSRKISIHAKNATPEMVRNTAHFIQCSNEVSSCPVFDGDTRITMIYVGDIDPMDMIPKDRMYEQLEKEAPDFLAELLSIELPEPYDRMNVPVLVTDDKQAVADSNKNALEAFIQEHTFPVKGSMIKFSDFYDRFIDNCEPRDLQQWASKIRVSRAIPREHIKGRNMKDGGHFYLTNISWEPGKDLEPLKVEDGVIKCL